ncbi:MAG: tyrosine-type recombinase/integrase [Alphaproteobacteria bacterium]|nr:tyrosine-type recombinase/integrase [Alphaproteobacteria bacterium]
MTADSPPPASGREGEPAPARPPDACAEAAHGALSANTERARRSDLRIFAEWCAARGRPALPDDPGTVAAFVDSMAETRAPATVRRYVASVAAARRAAGEGGNGTAEPVRLALQRMHRRKGRRQEQAKGLTFELRQRMLEAAGDRLIDVRNRALLAMAYDTLLRRSELVALEVTDIVEETCGAATVLVRRSKADPEGCGETVYLAPESMELVRTWLRRSGVAGGRVFRSLSGGPPGDGLDASQVPRIFKAMARRAGLPEETVARISGHSARVGAAQDMVAEGIGMAAILQAGRWKSPAMVNRYGERLLASRSGAAQLARRQRRG